MKKRIRHNVIFEAHDAGKVLIVVDSAPVGYYVPVENTLNVALILDSYARGELNNFAAELVGDARNNLRTIGQPATFFDGLYLKKRIRLGRSCTKEAIYRRSITHE